MSVDNSAHIKTAELKGMPLNEFFSGAYALTHSECCICSRPLRDAQSVEIGIGPICRKNYGYDNTPATDPNLVSIIGHLTYAKIDADVMKYVLANKGSVRMMANILIAYCTHLMGLKQGAKILDITPAIRELGFDTLASKLEKDRTNHKFFAMANGMTFFRTTRNSVANDLHRYLGVSAEKVKGYKGKGFVLDQSQAEVAEYLLAGEIGGSTELVFINGGAAVLKAQPTYKVPPAIANYVAPIDPLDYEYVIEYDQNLGLSVFTYPYPCPKVYYGMKEHADITPKNVTGRRYKVSVLETPEQVALAIWLVAGQENVSEMYINGIVVPLSPQNKMPIPHLVANKRKKKPAEIDFKVWAESALFIGVQTPVPWDHNWVKPLQVALKQIGAKFDRNGKFWKIPVQNQVQMWQLISHHSGYCRNEF